MLLNHIINHKAFITNKPKLKKLKYRCCREKLEKYL